MNGSTPIALDGLDEQLVRPLAQLDIGRDDVLDHVRHLGIGHRRTEQRAELGLLVGAAAERDLEEFLAVLLDAEKADVADMVVAAGIDAAGNIDVQPADVLVACPGSRKRRVSSCATGIERVLARLQ